MKGKGKALEITRSGGSNPSPFTMIEMSVEEYKEEIKKKNKYGAKKTVCAYGHTHDSFKEATRCSELNVLQSSSVITHLKQQPVFVLQKKCVYEGKIIRPITYRADFSYIEDGVKIIEDSKGMRTEVFKIKRKMLLYKIKNKGWKFIET